MNSHVLITCNITHLVIEQREDDNAIVKLSRTVELITGAMPNISST